MGRFDALTQLEETQEKKTPLSAVPSPRTNTPQTQTHNNENDPDKKPANPQTRKTENPFTRKPANPPSALALLDKPEKYTTRLEPSLIKKIRLHAIEKDMKDYEVVRTALHEYLERNK